ncbi:lysophospholipid acyltransferase family protein [Rhodobacter calidifons]|uniref:Lysophospholipid acyltransferase family protein n=1 Tax=Rhodobacter calidifons TaxID=2715277 RepID=A0ABX0G9W7_9RHOB|nr:lysophospholipid acyltransferase family protein [Rhodobacter calidifons]NHB77668.1 lysophospholipid acyltransferase family protein [Rhodobacter calidifons]
MHSDGDAPPFRPDHFAINLVARGLIGLGLALPYAWRVPLVGWLMRRVIGPLAGYDQRARENLAMVWPDRPLAERKAIAAAALDNAGRTLIENYSTRDFLARARTIEPEGPGYRALIEAREAGRPVILVSGHFGNYEAARAALVARGFDIGGLYRNLSNRYFNAHYVRTMQAFGGPVFPQGRVGTAGFVRHLKAGGQLVLLFDQDVPGAPALPFLGHPARTALSAAELALRLKAQLIPFFATRAADGLGFRVELDAPIPHSDPETMMRAVTSALEARVQAHPGQWFWIHRRWKGVNPA